MNFTENPQSDPIESGHDQLPYILYTILYRVEIVISLRIKKFHVNDDDVIEEMACGQRFILLVYS